MLSQDTVNYLTEWSIWPIIEFFSISVAVLVCYMAIHKIFLTLKPATKMLISMCIGTLGYTVGKLVVISLIVDPVKFGL